MTSRRTGTLCLRTLADAPLSRIDGEMHGTGSGPLHILRLRGLPSTRRWVPDLPVILVSAFLLVDLTSATQQERHGKQARNGMVADTGLGVIRQADAGFEIALQARELPVLERRKGKLRISNCVGVSTDNGLPSAGPLARSAKGPSPKIANAHTTHLVVGDHTLVGT